MYCRTCHYSLTGLPAPRCPECATAFDPSNPSSYVDAPPTRRARGIALAVRISPVLLAAVIWAHVLLTELGDPLGRGFDTALWVAATALKVATVISLILLLSRVQRTLADDGRAAVRAFLTLACCLVAGVAFLAAIREPLVVPRLSNGAVTYYGTASAQPYLTEYLERWLPRWRRGQILAEEAGLAVALAAAYALIGRTAGHSAAARLPLTVVATAALLILQFVAFNPWAIDFDNFHGDIFSGALTVDLIFPLALDPYTPIASVMYLALAAGCAIVLRQPPKAL